MRKKTSALFARMGVLVLLVLLIGSNASEVWASMPKVWVNHEGGTRTWLSNIRGVHMTLWDDSDTRYKPAYFDWLQEYGINSIMLDFGWNKLEPVKGVYNQSYLNAMDTFIQNAKARGITVVLRMHKWPYPNGYQAQEPNNIWLLGYPAWLNNTPDFWENVGNCWDNYVAMWTMLATRYKNEPSIVGFDLFGEPGNDIGPVLGDNGTSWWTWDSNAARLTMAVLFDNNRLYERTINAIHSITAKTIIIESFGGGVLGYAKTPGGPLTMASEPQSQNFVVGGSIYQDIQWAWVDNWKAEAGSWNVQFLATEFGVKEANITQPDPNDVVWVQQACQHFTANVMGSFYWGFGPGPNGDYNLVRDTDGAISPILTDTLPYC